jgi:hypothetical protein
MLHGRPLNIVAVLQHEDGSSERFECTNIVTNAGDIYYAQKACGEAPTNVFDALHLGTGALTPAKTDTATQFTAIVGSGKAVASTYPKSNDSDTDNTGKAVDAVTWKFSYPSSDGPWTAITEAIIVVGSGTLTSGEAVLTHFRFAASFDKTTTDTLTVYVNHAAEGV